MKDTNVIKTAANAYNILPSMITFISLPFFLIILYIKNLENIINIINIEYVFVYSLIIAIAAFSIHNFVTSMKTKLDIASKNIEKERALRMEIEKDLQRANQVKSLFMANVGHELKTPLNAIIGFSELLISEEKKYENLQMLETISASGKHLLEIVNGVLDLQQYNLKKIKCELKKTNLKALSDEVMNLTKITAEAKGLKTSYCVSERASSRIILSDPVKLKQIMINLMDNAIKYTHKGIIFLSIDSAPAQIEGLENITIRVSDTGIGIAKDKLSDIFNPFFQIDDSLSKNYPGLGIGLGLVKAIADCLDAEIKVESEENKGSVFQISFSSKTAEKEEISPKPSETCHKNSLAENEKFNLLLIDSDQTTRWLIGKIAEKYNICRVIYAGGLGEAEKALRENEINIALIEAEECEEDLQNLNCIIENKCAETGIEIKKIIFSSFDSQTKTDHLVSKFGFNGFLNKPVDINKLLSLIKQPQTCTVENKIK